MRIALPWSRHTVPGTKCVHCRLWAEKLADKGRESVVRCTHVRRACLAALWRACLGAARAAKDIDDDDVQVVLGTTRLLEPGGWSDGARCVDHCSELGCGLVCAAQV